MNNSGNNRIIALTGGTGFLGIPTVHALIAAGYQVRLLTRDRNPPSLLKPLPANVQLLNVDFHDLPALVSACRDCVAVIHAIGVVGYSHREQQIMFEANVKLTENMFSAAKRAKVPRFIHVSSIVTLGHSREPRNENASFNASDLNLGYWNTKLQAEQLALSNNQPGFEVVVVNPGSLLGKGERSKQLTNSVRALAKSRFSIVPAGGSDFVDARDIGTGIVQALERGKAGERYILGAENLTYAEFHARVRQALGASRPYPLVLPKPLLSLATRLIQLIERVFGTDRFINSSRLRRVNGVYLFHDLSKSRKELGYAPQPIDRALREMAK